MGPASKDAVLKLDYIFIFVVALQQCYTNIINPVRTITLNILLSQNLAGFTDFGQQNYKRNWDTNRINNSLFIVNILRLHNASPY